MESVQLEFNFDNKNPVEMEIYYLRKQISEMNDSMGKVRRKLFAEMTETKRMCTEIQKQNESLRAMIHEKEIEWDYNKPGYLFDIKDKVVAFS